MLLTLAIAAAFLLVLQIVIFSTQARKAKHIGASYSEHEHPLVFPHGCLNCRAPATLPWVYRESPEVYCCPNCQTGFEVSFVPGGVGNAPRYEWVEQDSSGNGALEASVSDCPDCRSRLAFYIERRANSARRPIARCRKCGSSS